MSLRSQLRGRESEIETLKKEASQINNRLEMYRRVVAETRSEELIGNTQLIYNKYPSLSETINKEKKVAPQNHDDRSCS